MKKKRRCIFSSESCPLFGKQNQNSTFIAAKVQIYTKNLRFVSINIVLDIYNVFLISSVEGNFRQNIFPRGEGAGVGGGAVGCGAYGVLTSDFKWEGWADSPLKSV